MNPLVCYKNDHNVTPEGLFVCYKDNQDIEPEALAALDGLNSLLMQSEMGLTEEIQATNQIAQESFQQMKMQFEILLKENLKLREQLILADSQQHQLETTYQSEIEAWREKTELAEKSLEDLRQKKAYFMQQAKAEQEEAIQAKEKAVKIAIETGNARVNAIKQQINANLGDVYLNGKVHNTSGHYFNKAAIHAISLGADPHCSCHGREDPNNYYNTIYLYATKMWPNASYMGESRIRSALAEALSKQMDTLKKIGS